MFRYVNVNPDNENIDDCVTRAISLASGYSYYDIQEKLYLTSLLFGCDRLNMCCYSNLIEKVFECEPVYCNGLTVEEFCEEYPIGTYLVRINGHITTVSNGCIYDTWDCSDEICTNAWFIS